MTLAETRRRLSVGTQHEVEYLASKPLNVHGNLGNFKMELPPKCKRKVVKQTPRSMVCVYLDGPKQGTNVYCEWVGLKARDENGSIILFEDGRDFLKLTPLEDNPTSAPDSP